MVAVATEGILIVELTVLRPFLQRRGAARRGKSNGTTAVMEPQEI